MPPQRLAVAPPAPSAGAPQDDEALVLYAVVRGMRMEAVVEIGGLDSYSAANFIQAGAPLCCAALCCPCCTALRRACHARHVSKTAAARRIPP